MYDINFFKKCRDIKKDIMAAGASMNSVEIYNIFEKFRSKRPFVFNIETTNACNMECIMCPRPKLIKRTIEHMDMALFEKIVAQITPYSNGELNNFWKLINDGYSINPCDNTEIAFYFYTLSKCLILHGYGEPPLDPYLSERIELCSKHKIPTYFSCVPSNIDVEKFAEMMEKGLGVIKFSLDALDDEKIKRIRGHESDFTDSFKKILKLIDIRSKNPSIKTEIAVTMIALSRSEEAVQMYKDFMNLWRDKPVRAHIKSQDNKWYYQQSSDLVCHAHYESQYCEYPFTSATIMVDGSVVPCTQDYNCEMVFGNVKSQSLEEIWNSDEYKAFRKWHIFGDFPQGHKCVSRCDQKLVCDRLKGSGA